MMAIFPKEKVSVGDTWHDTLSLDLGFPIDIETTYILKNREGGTAYIDAIAKIDMGSNSTSIGIGPNKTTVEIAGTLNAANQIDEKTGLVKKIDKTTNFSGVIKMEPPTDSNKPMPAMPTIPISITGTTTMELIK
jgi:hypothetical protein